MDTSRLEELLEQLLDKQDQLIARIESLEATVQQELAEANSGISDLKEASSIIHEELKWWGEGESLAKQLLKTLDSIESAVSQ